MRRLLIAVLLCALVATPALAQARFAITWCGNGVLLDTFTGTSFQLTSEGAWEEFPRDVQSLDTVKSPDEPNYEIVQFSSQGVLVNIHTGATWVLNTNLPRWVAMKNSGL